MDILIGLITAFFGCFCCVGCFYIGFRVGQNTNRKKIPAAEPLSAEALQLRQEEEKALHDLFGYNAGKAYAVTKEG